MTASIAVTPAEPKIQVLSHQVPSPTSSLPPLSFQVTLLDRTCMVWAGIHDSGSTRLASNWTCAMPPFHSSLPASSTSLYHSSQADYGQSLAPLLSKRFNRQIYLALDLGPALAVEQSDLLLHLEKHLTAFLKKTVASMS